MATIKLEVHTAELLLKLRGPINKLAFTTTNAINATAKELQILRQKGMARRFKVRKARFITQEAAKRTFASKVRGVYSAEIYVGQKDRLMLSEYEQDFTKTSLSPKPAPTIGIPVTGGPARPTFEKAVAPKYQLERLKFGSKAAPVPAIVASKKLWLVAGVGIFTRKPAGRRRSKRILAGKPPKKRAKRVMDGKKRIFDATAVYYYKPSVRLKRRLGFVEEIVARAPAIFREHVERETIKAIQHAAGRYAPGGGN